MDLESSWRQFGDQLKAFVRARVADDDTAEELTQQLLIKVHQNLPRLRDEERLEAWMYRIARNLINDHYRHSARRAEADSRDVYALAESLEEDQEAPSAIEDLTRCVQPLVDQLPDKYRHVITAVDMGGRSQKALAEEMGVSHSTVKSQTQRGRARLHQLFRRCCDFSVDARGNLMDFQPKGGFTERPCQCD